ALKESGSTARSGRTFCRKQVNPGRSAPSQPHKKPVPKFAVRLLISESDTPSTRNRRNRPPPAPLQRDKSRTPEAVLRCEHREHGLPFLRVAGTRYGQKSAMRW